VPHFEETFTIGDLVRKETEVVQGDTLEILVKAPGGTTGKTFVSQFQHKSYVNTSMPVPVPGVDLAGLFTVTVVDLQSIKLSTPTSSLLPGRYLYKVTATAAGAVNTSSLREFLVLASSIPDGSTGSVLTPAADTAAQIAQHNSDPSAHGELLNVDNLYTLVYLPSGVYTLPDTVASPSKLKMFVNGAKQQYGLDYTISGTQLSWVSANLQLSTYDTIEVYL
jgi:hypothetical protein